MRRYIISLLALLAAAVTAFAQGTIRVEVHNIVGLDEKFNVVFIVEGEKSPSSFEWSEGEDFDRLWGPQKGSSTSISIINGKTTKSAQTTYTYILQPRRTGTFSLPAATAKIGGEEVSSGRFTIQVVDNGASRSQQQAAPSQGQAESQQPRQSTSSQDEIFMKFSISSTSAVVGEPITATLKLYQRANIAGFEEFKAPTFNGFWSQETEAPQNVEFHREQVGDKIYNAAVLRRYMLIPQKQGELTIESAELTCLVNVRTRSSGPTSIFDAFFQDNVATIRKRVTTPAVKVHVSALPAGAPPSFAGGVGEYNISAKFTKDSLAAHEASSLIVTVTGKGNVSLLEAPKIQFPVDFEVYDVKATKATDRSGTSGSKTFEYPFIPRSHGDFVLPPVKYSYYNAKSRRYVTTQTDSLRISVARGAETPAVEGAAGVLTVDKRGVKTLGEDIRYIHSRGASRKAPSFFVAKPAYYIIALVLLIAAVIIWFALRRIAALRSDVALSRNRKATKMALKRLKLSGEYLRQNLRTAFYEELHRALIGFISDKLSMNMADQTKENIAAELVSRGVSEQTAGEFTSLLDECEYARYAPSSDDSAMKQHYDSAVKLITAIDSSVKSSPKGGPAAMVIALLLMAAPFAQAQEPDSLWTSGIEAYTNSDFQGAETSFQAIVDAGNAGADVYYNLGNALFKQREYGKAILAYERALRLDPTDADIAHNLEFARAQTIDRIDSVPEFFLKTVARKICYSLSSNLWAWLSLLLFAATLALVLLFLLGRTSGARKAGFFSAIVTLLLTVTCWSFARQQYRDAVSDDEAIVLKSVAAAKSSPSADDAKDLFVLHEGTKVTIRDSVGEWRLVVLADGRQGWLPANTIEII